MSKTSHLVPAVAGLVLAAGAAAQTPYSKIHPYTNISLGLAFGDQDVETNTGNPNPGGRIQTSETDATHFRIRGEHFFESEIGVFVGAYFGFADDINQDPPLSSPSSSWDSTGLFLALSYRATMEKMFRMPIRFGPFLQSAEEQDTTFVNGNIERSMYGLRLSAEPEIIVMKSESDGKWSELVAFTELTCGAGPAKVEDNVDSEDGYAFTFSWELGMRYRLTSGLYFGLSYFAQKVHTGTTESYNRVAFFGVDDDFTGIMITAGFRF
ncbi:MAG: hypothetical protein WAT39_23185 [Planctomycetota bacterium]